MTAPVVVLLQGSVSVVGILANLLAAPLGPGGHRRRCRGGPHLRGVVARRVLVAWAGVVPTTGIAQVARRFAEVPGGTLPWPDGAPGALLLAALTVAVLLTGRALASGVAAHPVPAVGTALIVAAALVPTRAVTWPPDGWRVVVCDVGQGDAVVLRSGPHRAVLVDAGPDPPLVDRCLSHLGVDTLDAVVLTHFHADHVDGLSGAVDGRAVEQLLVGPVREPAESADQVERVARAHGIPVTVLHAGDRLAVGEVTAAVWSPWRRIADGSVPNNASLVLAVRTGTVDALLLGDVEREAAHDLLLRIRREPSMALAATRFRGGQDPAPRQRQPRRRPDGRRRRTRRHHQRRQGQRLRPPGSRTTSTCSGTTVTPSTAPTSVATSRSSSVGEWSRSRPPAESWGFFRAIPQVGQACHASPVGPCAGSG